MRTRMLAVGLLLVCLLPRVGAGECAITGDEVAAAQKNWGEAIVAIGAAKTKGADYKALARELVTQLYAFDLTPVVLFKPTKAAEMPFRPDKESAISYFVGGGIQEDHGFALQPWTQVRFADVQTSLHGGCAVSMGHYFFTDAATGKETKVEFTFAYVKDCAGSLRIFAHHSSLPYTPAH